MKINDIKRIHDFIYGSSDNSGDIIFDVLIIDQKLINILKVMNIEVLESINSNLEEISKNIARISRKHGWNN